MEEKPGQVIANSWPIHETRFHASSCDTLSCEGVATSVGFARTPSIIDVRCTKFSLRCIASSVRHAVRSGARRASIAWISHRIERSLRSWARLDLLYVPDSRLQLRTSRGTHQGCSVHSFRIE